MNKKNIIIASIIGGVGVLAYSIYHYIDKQKKLIEQFTYKIVGIQLGDFDLNIIKGSISVLFSSQADIEVEVKAFYLDFYFNQNKVGYLEEASSFIIPAKGSSTIDLDFTLNPQLVLGNAVDIIDYTLNSKDADIYVSGYAKLKSGFINVTLPIEYNTTLRELLK